MTDIENKNTNKYSFDRENHVHLLNGKPLIGTSSVCGIVAKPLSWWASGKAVEVMGWTDKKQRIANRLDSANLMLEKIKCLETREYLKLLDQAYGNHNVSLSESAGKGTDLHFELETWIKGQITGENKEPIEQIIQFVNWCRENVDRFLWTELHMYSETNWTGGICDLGIRLKNGKIGVLDHKSAKEAYYTHFLQDGGYVLQIEENMGGFDENGNRIFELEHPIDFIGVVPYGGSNKIPVLQYNVREYKEEFIAALKLYRGNKRYSDQHRHKPYY